MTAEYHKVEQFVRGVVDGKVVVRRPGARIPLHLAVKLGLVDEPSSSTTSARKPRRPAGAQPPRARTTGRR